MADEPAQDAESVAGHHPDCEGWMRDWRERAHAAEAEVDRLMAYVETLVGQGDDLADALTEALEWQVDGRGPAEVALARWAEVRPALTDGEDL